MLLSAIFQLFLIAVAAISIATGLATIYKRRLQLASNLEIVGTPAVVAGFGLFGSGAYIIGYFIL